MPQLDIASYFSQYIWLAFFFLSFYSLLATIFLPKISRIFKVRSSLTKKSSVVVGTQVEAQVDSLPSSGVESNIGKNQISSNIFVSRDNSTISRFKFSQTIVRTSFSHLKTWIDSSVVFLRSKRTAQFLYSKLHDETLANLRVLSDRKTLSVISGSSYSIKNKGQTSQEAGHKYHTKKTIAFIS